eukprot:TRINITY_DN3876_c0_g1_i2.p2 TRINITY_DN3876_c0_g1~~TRINITY_DN3876_c0_g1_i2.p2  ORF type:complete len:145 (+),score=27.95 TRINITY_DN3876_c0_g1_i2:200-634(+)
MKQFTLSVFIALALFAWIGQEAVAQLGSSEDVMDAVEEDTSPDVEENSCEGSVTYRVSADFVWSAVTHPINYPSSAHWSRLSGTTHNENYQMWQGGMLSSPGVKQVAELGVNSILRGEIEDCGKTPREALEAALFETAGEKNKN